RYWPFLLEFIDGGLRILKHRIPIRICDEFSRIRDFVGRIATLETLLGSVEQRGRDRRIALGREAVANRPDGLVNAEDLLNNDHATLRRASRINSVRAEFVAVISGECELLTQVNLLFQS